LFTCFPKSPEANYKVNTSNNRNQRDTYTQVKDETSQVLSFRE
jgi:hypothetical protein